ncbi:hypothetical protein CEXT_202751 [Caerostris extrusa]|uniref:Uncharacterized protein n=1 Tax=Caerostris extrusa TaxID=172846 RepID=A0AAV4PF31_CAEEX|nr:hypothetical protein CEXT_202751 [Caerostris extrusa]
MTSRRKKPKKKKKESNFWKSLARNLPVMQSKRPLTRVSSERLNRKLHFVRRLPAKHMQRLTFALPLLGICSCGLCR